MTILELSSATPSSPIYQRMSETRKAEVIAELSTLLGASYVLYSAYDLTMYEYDASSIVANLRSS